MTRTSPSLAAAFAAIAFAAPALAQDVEFRLPEQCTSESAMGEMDHSAMGHGDQGGGMMGADMDGMPEHVQENMQRMMVTMPAMQMGMANEDADVAFACGMIAHHQGAIDMAQVLLAHGDDAEMRALAEEIIEAQVAEIAQMTDWLSENAGQ